MNPMSSVLFPYLLFFSLGPSGARPCSLEPEIPRTSNTVWKDNFTSSRFPYIAITASEGNPTCRLQKEKYPVSESLELLDFLLKELEYKRDCTFDETQWKSLTKSQSGFLRGKRITDERDLDIYVIPNFLTPRQCQDLIDVHKNVSKGSNNQRWKFGTTKQLLNAVHKASLSPSEYNISIDSSNRCDGGILDGVQAGEKLRKVLNFSSSVLVPRGESFLVDFVEKNIQRVFGLPRTNAFHTQLIRYQTNSEYKAHTDCQEIENDRMATIIIYLSDVMEGGETKFPFLNKSIEPKRGMAVVWKNLDSQGNCDLKTAHIAGRVNQGEKYIYQKWFYENPILPRYQSSDYIFCDLSQSCRQYIYAKSTAMAVKYMNKGQESENEVDALKYYKMALNHQPLHSASLILYADLLNKLGYSSQALPYLFSLLKMHPRNKDAIEILRSVVENLGKPGKF